MSVYADHGFEIGSQNNSWAHLYELIPEKSRVLDVGCSTALFGKFLTDHKGCEVVGIDLDVDDITKAKENIAQAFVMDINSQATKQLGMFDAIIFADVLEHLVDPRETLRKLKKEMLKQGGGVYFSIPHMAHMSVRLGLLSGKFPYKERGLLDRTHLHFYDQDEVESMFIDSGYSISAMRPTVSSYPKELVTDKLNLVGLKNTDKFMQALDETHASLFQFIGSAQPVVQNRKSTIAPYVMPQDEIMNYSKTILTENERLWLESQQLHKRVQELSQELSDIRNQPVRHSLKQIKNTVLKKAKRSSK